LKTKVGKSEIQRDDGKEEHRLRLGLKKKGGAYEDREKKAVKERINISLSKMESWARSVQMGGVGGRLTGPF